MIFRIFKVSLALILILTVSSVIMAQDVTDEELIDRILATTDIADQYESFVVNLIIDGEQLTSAEFSGQNLEQVTMFNSEYNVTVIRGESPMAYGTVVATVSYDDQTTAFAYVIETEVRYIDGVLYANGTYVEGGEELPPLPVGWVIVEDPVNDLNFGSLELSRIVEWAVIEEDDDASPDSLERILGSATSLTLTEDEIDGVTVEVLGATFGWDGVVSILAESPEEMTEDPLFALIGEQLSESDDLMTVSVALDSDEQIRASSMAFTIDVSELAGDALGIPGGTVNIMLTNSESTSYAQINETFDAVETPEVSTGG